MGLCTQQTNERTSYLLDKQRFKGGDGMTVREIDEYGERDVTYLYTEQEWQDSYAEAEEYKELQETYN